MYTADPVVSTDPVNLVPEAGARQTPSTDSLEGPCPFQDSTNIRQIRQCIFKKNCFISPASSLILADSHPA